MNKRYISLILVLCMIISCIAVSGVGATAQTADIAQAGADYGLASSCQDGNILQCFNWTLSQIKDELPNIAKAGFTSVQTSPLQPHDGSYQWYWLYQPTNFTIGNEIGSLNDLKSLCTEADKYGIKIIVDVVANHLAGSNNGSWSGKIDSSLRKSEYFHNLGACEDDSSDRFNITHKNIGMPDLNSEHTDIQNKVATLVRNLKSAGVDGIRWDAAKHISLPSEDCNFWPTVAISGMYHYGEILDAPASSKSLAYVNNALMTEYSNYIGVTDELHSTAVMTALKDGRVAKSAGTWNKRGVSAERIVYWGESHDTYGNNGSTNDVDQNVVDRAYAIMGARASSQALYLSRPFEKSHTSIAYAKKGSTHFTSKEVAAVNHFHNAMIGTEEKYYSGGGCYIIARGGGAVIVSPKDSDFDISVANSGGAVPAGTYTDEVSGSKFTVTATTITGHIGSTGIAVFYDKNNIGKKLLIGDADLNGEITILDATCIQRYLAKLESLSADALKAADSDISQEVTIVDATLIQRMLAKLPDTKSHVGEYTS